MSLVGMDDALDESEVMYCLKYIKREHMNGTNKCMNGRHDAHYILQLLLELLQIKSG